MQKRGFGKILVLILLLSGCSVNTLELSSNYTDPIMISISPNPDTGLFQIAKEKGYFREQGLDITLVNHDYGKVSLASVLNNEVEFGVSAEIPIVNAALEGKEFLIMSKISSSNNLEGIIARKGADITSVADLSGKTIGTPTGSSAEYFLSTFLLVHGVQESSVNIVDIKPRDLLNSIKTGKVDAVAIWEPEIQYIQQSLIEESILFYGDNLVSSFKFYFVGNKDFIISNPDVVEGIMRALIQAEQFIRDHSSEATAIISSYTGVSEDFIDRVYQPTKTLRVTLDQTMLLVLEDQSRWLVNKSTIDTKTVNYLDYIYIDGLDAVKPNAVTIIR